MKQVTRQELKEILEEHRLWWNGKGGQRAYLRGAYLRGANLQGADLRGANLQGANLPPFQIPQHGELRVYKKAGGKIVHLKIPRGVARTASLIGRKCRAAGALVLAIQGDKPVTAPADSQPRDDPPKRLVPAIGGPSRHPRSTRSRPGRRQRRRVRAGRRRGCAGGRRRQGLRHRPRRATGHVAGGRGRPGGRPRARPGRGRGRRGPR